MPPQTGRVQAPLAAPPTAGAQARWQARRRRPGMLALAVACIAACAVGNWWYWTENGQRQPIIGVAHEVPAGSVIKDSDLREASVAVDPSMKVIGIQQRDQVAGMRAVATLQAGSLLHPKEVTRKALVTADEQLVGIALEPGQLPDSALRPGDQVQAVFTSDDPGAEAAEGMPPSIQARVVRVGAARESTGERVVDVAVPKAQGPQLAAQAAAGDVALTVSGASS
ncbi:hypothetical protein GCM10010431_87000 [Streptomyces kunmingensis]